MANYSRLHLLATTNDDVRHTLTRSDDTTARLRTDTFEPAVATAPFSSLIQCADRIRGRVQDFECGVTA